MKLLLIRNVDSADKKRLYTQSNNIISTKTNIIHTNINVNYKRLHTITLDINKRNIVEIVKEAVTEYCRCYNYCVNVCYLNILKS